MRRSSFTQPKLCFAALFSPPAPGRACENQSPVTVEQFYSELSAFAGTALIAVVVGVMTRFSSATTSSAGGSP
jgi:ABC-type long-subunit fatty acid transport system fused permease/ATPase subunit